MCIPNFRRRRARVLGPSLALFSLTGCIDPAPKIDYGDPTSLDEVTVQGGIYAQFVAPTDRESHEPRAALTLRAWVDGETPTLVVDGRNGEGTWQRASAEGPPGPDQRFRFEVDLLHGDNLVSASILDTKGSRRRVLPYRLNYTGSAPGLLVEHVTRPLNDQCPTDPIGPTVHAVNSPTICLYGRTSVQEGRTLTSVRAVRDDVVVDHETPSARFALQVPLAPNSNNPISIASTDDNANTTTRTIEILHSDALPTLDIVEPMEAHVRTSQASIRIQGTASDSDGLDRIDVYVGTSFVRALPGEPQFDFNLPLRPGDNHLRLVAYDIAGNAVEQTRTIVRSRVTTLHATRGRGGETLLQLDRIALTELLDEDAQKEIILAQIGLRPFLYQAVAAIRDPYAFGNDPADFGQAEYNFYRLLNLSADTADMTGTSLGNLSDLSYAIGLPTARVLAELLDTEVDAPALTTDLIVDVLINNLIRTHPNAEFDDSDEPVLNIRLHDALNNLEPLADRFGPVASTGHPGIIGGAITAPVFEPGFMMSVRAISNLVPYDGFDGAGGTKAFVYILNGEQVLELDVFDDQTFSVVGLVDEPIVDVTIAMNESPQFITAGTQKAVNPDPNRPGFFRGGSAAWTIRPWLLERIVLETVYARFVDTYAHQNHQATLAYDAGSIVNAATFVWDKGWLKTTTAGNLGNPPPEQYVWDALLELAQVRLHDGGLAEGQANARFELSNVPVGIDADGLIRALRPELHRQQERLSELLLGSDGVAPTALDFYYVASVGDAALLFFRHPDDSGEDYSFATPGFFRDAALNVRADVTGVLPGTDNTTHHKVAAKAGERLFYADEDGTVFQIDIVAVRAKELDLVVSPAEAP